MCSEARVDMI